MSLKAYDFHHFDRKCGHAKRRKQRRSHRKLIRTDARRVVREQVSDLFDAFCDGLPLDEAESAWLVQLRIQ